MRFVLALCIASLCFSIRAEAQTEWTSCKTTGTGLELHWAPASGRFVVEYNTPPTLWPGLMIYSASGPETNAVQLTPDSPTGWYRLWTGISAVTIPDANLSQALSEEVSTGPWPTNALYDVQLQPLTNLNIAALNIYNLTGLEASTNLTVLDAAYNPAPDLSAIATLTNLTTLYLNDSQLIDISALAGLTQLVILDLSGNNITSALPLIVNAQAGGLGTNDTIYLSGNPLANTNEVVQLRTYGATVFFP